MLVEELKGQCGIMLLSGIKEVCMKFQRLSINSIEKKRSSIIGSN